MQERQTLRDIFADVFDMAVFVALMIPALVFLLLSLFIGFKGFLSDPLYYLPFILIPPIVVSLPFLFAAAEKEKG